MCMTEHSYISLAAAGKENETGSEKTADRERCVHVMLVSEHYKSPSLGNGVV